MNLNDLPDMSDALKAVQMYEKKKLDPVGKEDSDIDNDGDVDKSDSYLKNRRKAIGKAIKKEEVEVEEGYKPLPKEKMARQANKAYDKEQRAAAAGDEKETNKQMQRRIAIKDPSGRKAALKKEAFAFSQEELEELVLHAEEIDAATDEELVEFFKEAIMEMAEDDQDLIEICEHLESVEMLTEVSDKYYDSAVKASKDAAKKNRPSRMDRLKSAAKKAGSAIKKGVKAAGKSVAKNAGKAVGEFQAARIKQKRAAMSRPTKQSSSKSSSSDSKSSSSDDDGTGGKLDALLAKSRGTSSSSNSSGGGSSSGGSAPAKKKKGPGLLRKVGSAVKKGLKKAVGKTARVVSKGSGALAKRLGEDYETIAHLHESGLFSMEEIEAVVLESEKNIRGYDSEEQKKRLEKKRGMKLDDHPQFKKENK